jgi:DNA mismatch repair protein MutS
MVVRDEKRVAEAIRSAVFRSVLFDGVQASDLSMAADAPECFPDLNLDQVVAAITRDRAEYRLEPFFHTPLTDVAAIEYRHEVFRDLRRPGVLAAISVFADAMVAVRKRLTTARKLHFELQRQFLMLGAHRLYHEAIISLRESLDREAATSRGLLGMAAYLRDYASSPEFVATVDERVRVEAGLDAIRYDVHLQGRKVTVTPFDDEPDYSAEVEKAFEKFRQGDVRSHLVRFADHLDMNQVEENILILVAQLNPAAFTALHSYVANTDFIDHTMGRFDREVQFYLGYLALAAPLEAAGLQFCFPTVSASKAVRAADTFDIALADKLVADRAQVVTNDFALRGDEHVIVVSGANQGGKTTFSRTFGQLHHLASIGCPVPGREAALFLFDHIYTHYEKEEDIHNRTGKLEDELLRIHEILQAATSDSIVIMNEIFTSTTLEDAVRLGTAVLRQIIDRGILSVCVTFVDELSTLSETTVSMVARVDPDDPARRTFRLERRPADGLAHAVAIAEKYGLTYRRLTERIAS